jgi:hypothetical protein
MNKPDRTTAVDDVAQKHLSDAPSSISAMKSRQCAKIAELRRVLLVAGYHSLNKQAIALGLSRSTTWAILQANHKSSGLSGSLIKRMLRSRELSPAARQWIEEYVAEKLTGAYGHKRNRLRIFRAQVDLPVFAPPESLERAACQAREPTEAGAVKSRASAPVYGTVCRRRRATADLIMSENPHIGREARREVDETTGRTART